LAKADVSCAVCATVFKVTKKNVDARMHADSKHSKNTFEECFPSIVADDKAEAAEEAVAKSAGGGGGAAKVAAKPKKKKDADMALLSEGLAGASVSKSKKK